MIQKSKILLIILLPNLISCQNYYPILLWHSAGESCCGDEINTLTNILRSQLGQAVYIKSVTMSDFEFLDKISSVTTNPFSQVDKVCREIVSDPKFQNGYNAIGMSQGGLFA